MTVSASALDKDLSEMLMELSVAIATLKNQQSKKGCRKLAALLVLHASLLDLQNKVKSMEATYRIQVGVNNPLV
ncbi:hypothetical protein [Flavisolibacter ginsenosidimutans]|uniref:Uncharacterized protein n=1 Tax=Flavisolibacter ginsenosidimutans TaxID=661481 RepID=A0A5B8UJH4_9BACT|nr:hypothetical protein [Flavisolibacter ginsenosidimutans]QEC56718.1 hypothetical protein FSB75_12690 [Flavisolibacter ginsenosidimutans]